MSDDRLFASNNAIGRKWFFLNIIIIIIITLFTGYIFDYFIFPYVKTNEYHIIAKSILVFLYIIYTVTFLSLIDRRIYDILGDRDKLWYKFLNSFIFLVVLFNVYNFCIDYNIVKKVIIPIDLSYFITICLNFLFIFIVFILGIIKGQISSISSREYKKKIRYKL